MTRLLVELTMEDDLFVKLGLVDAEVLTNNETTVRLIIADDCPSNRCREAGMNRFRVLLVDDHEKILGFLAVKLKSSGYDVLAAKNGAEALELTRENHPDLMVLDVMMPVKDGFETLKELRTFSPIPVIVLSVLGDDETKIRGLKLGADDYMAKPFNPDELVARIEALRRRAVTDNHTSYPADPFNLGSLTVDFATRRVVAGGQEIRLTRIEWMLMSELSRNVGRAIPYEELMGLIWGSERHPDVKVLRTWVCRLRRKLHQNAIRPTLIRTVERLGYILEPESAGNGQRSWCVSCLRETSRTLGIGHATVKGYAG
ncbi:MAG: response regulator transcription factor [Chloroflexi bacterium]|nr:response regulator transcription factor [Chloroflexota bacterium]